MSMFRRALVAGGILSFMAAAADAESVDLTCSTVSRPNEVALYVRVDTSSNTASAWTPGQTGAASAPATVTASQVTWTHEFSPYAVNYSLNRANGALTTQVTPNARGAAPVSLTCKRASPVF
ncbi:hypothetical protein [Phenylobacterium sp.]|uniref:hypothetical protein n=1 Tax=Phenylobacterium sp. TaxID=1871053 RepID=UPI002DECEB52|nr:hypothetical protein [Phenylobacterium sp.]